MRTESATLIGSTGLIGSHLLKLCQDDDHFSEIRVLVRRPVSISHPKIKVMVIYFADETAFKAGVAGCDAVFVAVGTTQKKVKGDKAA